MVYMDVICRSRLQSPPSSWLPYSWLLLGRRSFVGCLLPNQSRQVMKMMYGLLYQLMRWMDRSLSHHHHVVRPIASPSDQHGGMFPPAKSLISERESYLFASDHISHACPPT